MSRIRADKVINRTGSGAPELTYGASIPVGYAITGAGGVNVTGVITATSFVGALTGTATTTTNIPNLTGAITSVNTTTLLGSFTSLQLLTALTDETGTGAAVFATSPTLITPVLGTPSSGILTSCTGLPITGITSSTTIGLGVGSIELGHATDTTITRVSAGVVAIEGVNIVTISSTDTLTNKTLTSPILTTPSLGIATAISVVVGSGVTINTSGINAAAGIITATTFVGELTGTASTANAVNTSNSYQVAALGIGQAAGTGTEFDLAGRYAQTSIAVSALDIDCSLGNYFTKTISSSSTFTFSNIPASRSYSFTLCVTHDSGTITWPGSVKWPRNTAPTLNTNKKHTFMFSTNDGGSVFYGAALVDFTY